MSEEYQPETQAQTICEDAVTLGDLQKLRDSLLVLAPQEFTDSYKVVFMIKWDLCKWISHFAQEAACDDHNNNNHTQMMMMRRTSTSAVYPLSTTTNLGLERTSHQYWTNELGSDCQEYRRFDHEPTVDKVVTMPQLYTDMRQSTARRKPRVTLYDNLEIAVFNQSTQQVKSILKLNPSAQDFEDLFKHIIRQNKDHVMAWFLERFGSFTNLTLQNRQKIVQHMHPTYRTNKSSLLFLK